MSKDLKIVKKKLTNIFTAIVFLLLVFLGVLFFSIKLFTFTTDEKRALNHIVFSITENKTPIDAFIMTGKKFDNSFGNRSKQTAQNGEEDEELPKDFLNIIHLDRNDQEKNILIRDDVSDLDFDNILTNDSYKKIKSEGNFLIVKIELDNGDKVILIKALKYSLSDYLTDIVSFILVILLFSISLYFIGMKFINKVMVPVEENIADMKDFVHNAGHEIKTPLSVMDSNLQLLDSLKTYDQSMNNEMKNEVHKLNSIIDGLINLSDIDGFSKKEEIILYEMVEDILHSYDAKILSKKLSINTKIAKNVKIEANKNNLYMVLSNLIGNAIKYNKDNGKININYKLDILSIKDTGIGISKENIEKIFDRFYKEDKSRTTEGFGIGLALVKKIINLYGWKIKVDSEKGKGTTVNITF